MSENGMLHKKGGYLTDIDIAKILGLAHAGKSHREITDIMHCSKNPVQNTLAKYDFETFQGRDIRREY